MKTLTIAERAQEVLRQVAEACERAARDPRDVRVVAISKTFPATAIREAAAAGFREIGENRVQEAAEKLPELSDLDVTWHLVGHLQTNKVKAALQLFDVIQSVDSLHLAQAISSQAQKPVPVLLEVNVAAEASKYGFTPEELPLQAEAIAKLPNLEVRGLMTVAPQTEDPESVRWVFRRLRELRDSLGLLELSMGMTDDYPVAIAEGATLLRIGRAIFGERSQ